MGVSLSPHCLFVYKCTGSRAWWDEERASGKAHGKINRWFAEENKNFAGGEIFYVFQLK